MLDDMYISMQSRGFAQILLQQQKIANKQHDDDNELLIFSTGDPPQTGALLAILL